jgi:glyoxylate reductase
MSRPVVLADPLPDAFVERLTEFEIVAIDSNDDVASEAIGVMSYAHPTVDAALMDRLPNLKVISNHGVGVDHVDVAAATERNIPVGNTPGCLNASSADMTMALLLSLARNVRIGDRFARGPDFTDYNPALFIGQEVTGSSLGIVGLGRIGTEVAKRAAGFDMKIRYHNRNRLSDAIEKSLGVKYVPLDELLSDSDFISLNCPLTEETTGLIGVSEFALMKPTAMLINLARGPVVDTEALLIALTAKQIAAAAIDVTDPEPLPRDHPLLSLDNLIITPHLGSASNRTRQRMMDMTVENLRAGLAGQALPYPVNTIDQHRRNRT